MREVGRVSLSVGTNNRGKTWVLEALFLLASVNEPRSALWRVVSRRGERLYLDTPPRQAEIEFDVSHLFHNHEMKVGTSFSIATKNKSSSRSVKFEIQERKLDERHKTTEETGPQPIFLVITQTSSYGPPIHPPGLLQLTRRGGLRSEALESPRRVQRSLSAPDASTVQFISTESLSMDELLVMWNQITLTEAEQRVVGAIKFLEPKVQRIAPIVGTPPFYYTGRGGFVVKLSNIEQPIPIGSLGDGTWRMLALAIALSRAKDGILLVDEIDTGLHYTMMADMWRLISETAKVLNVQVFATTHSYDCVHSLAAICRSEADEGSAVTLQRIDASKKKSVPFTENEIKIAAERQIEVR